MSSEDESEDVEDQEKTDEKEDLPSSRQAKKVARLNQILYENEHKAKISKVCEKKYYCCRRILKQTLGRTVQF